MGRDRSAGSGRRDPQRRAPSPEGYALPAYAAVEIANAANADAEAAGGKLLDSLAKGSFTTAIGTDQIRRQGRSERKPLPALSASTGRNSWRPSCHDVPRRAAQPHHRRRRPAGRQRRRRQDQVRRHRGRLRRAGGRRRAGAGRRAGHARNRSARAAQFGRGDQRDRAVRRLGLRARRRLRRAGGAPGDGRRLRGAAAIAYRSCRRRSSSTCATAATRIGAAIRPIASSATRPFKRPPPISRSARSAPVPARWSAGLKGGLGSASTVLPNGVTVGALAIVNATGSVTVGRSAISGRHRGNSATSSAGSASPRPSRRMRRQVRLKFRDKPRAGENTTIAVIATDAVMTKAGAKRLAISAHDGFARAIWPAHTPVDGDLVFALATGRSGIALELDDAIDHYAAASATMARAIARAVYSASPTRRRPLPGVALRVHPAERKKAYPFGKRIRRRAGSLQDDGPPVNLSFADDGHDRAGRDRAPLSRASAPLAAVACDDARRFGVLGAGHGGERGHRRPGETAGKREASSRRSRFSSALGAAIAFPLGLTLARFVSSGKIGRAPFAACFSACRCRRSASPP